MFEKLFYLPLKSDLIEVVERVPKDLRVWERFIKSKKTSKKSREEYQHLYSFYVGKVMAYLYVLNQLGEHQFVSSFEKKHNLKYNKDWTRVVSKPRW